MILTARVVLLPASILIVLGLFGLVMIDQQLRGSMASRVEHELHRLAESSLVTLEDANRPLSIVNVDPVSKRLGEAGQVRITFVDASGVVAGDSNVEAGAVGSMSNHKDRSEFVDAKTVGWGHAFRYSETLRKDFFYVAVYRPIEIQGENIYYYARASVSSDVLKHQITQMRMALLSILLAGVILISAIAFLIVRRAAMTTLMRQAALEKEVSDKTAEIERMHELDSLLNACSDLNEASKVVGKIIPTLLSNSSGAISVYKSSRNQLKMLLFWGRVWGDSLYYNSDQCWALRKGHEHLSRLDSSQVECEHFTQAKDRATLCIPLIAHGETIGVMHVLKTQFEDQELVIAKAIAKRLAMSIANIELKSSLRQMAFKDPLTHLYNRRYLYETLEQWFSVSHKNRTEIGIVMIDLDHFKQLNDNYGHDAGDKVLKEISQFLLEATRASDIVCRYGGEEFCIAIPDTTAAELTQTVQKLCEELAEVSIEIGRTQRLKVTGSMGASIFTSHCNSIENTITEADEALYNAKEAGRNCVRFSKLLEDKLNASD
ncbi:diguanylate cyclase [Vibrio sp. ZSDE26]|uniref:diguanylate cyclase n=1 Tax=Vibrio amylolyticus TaxID=2847292 RepID=A0A9X1XJN4_9VIBR|nr:diguanylate cyclase [Vibrio amylolyticus]MCK6264227.1 diguanylate cyclase [Vibrio amylolyticus]